jgi:hypothetical protein
MKTIDVGNNNCVFMYIWKWTIIDRIWEQHKRPLNEINFREKIDTRNELITYVLLYSHTPPCWSQSIPLETIDTIWMINKKMKRKLCNIYSCISSSCNCFLSTPNWDQIVGEYTVFSQLDLLFTDDLTMATNWVCCLLLVSDIFRFLFKRCRHQSTFNGTCSISDPQPSLCKTGVWNILLSTFSRDG